MKSHSISSVEKLRHQVDTLDAHIDNLRRQREKTIKSLQARCKHPDIIEGEYYDGIYRALAPFRVCKSCGLAEEGWGCGYSKLETKNTVRSVSREYAQKFILKMYSQEEMHK